jgi:outer membrane immunogenic protein
MPSVHRHVSNVALATIGRHGVSYGFRAVVAVRRQYCGPHRNNIEPEFSIFEAERFSMKKIILGAVALVTIGVAPALAADLPARTYTKAPPIVAAMYDWSGFYIGLNGGGGSARKCWDYVDPGTGVLFDQGCHDATGGTVGGQIGYRWQVTNWVFGIEGQGNWADFTGSNRSLFFTNETNHSKIDAFGLITGQVGYA